MNAAIAALSAENAELRTRIHELEAQVRTLELAAIVSQSIISDFTDGLTDEEAVQWALS